MSKKIVEYTKLAPGMVKIESTVEGLLTLDRYIAIARDLLENGLEVNSNEKLKDMNTPEVIDNMLLYQELEKKGESEIKQVVFVYNGKEYLVNLKNIDRIITKKPEETPHLKAVKEAVSEMFER